MKIYGIIRDCGDGSGCIDWFDNEKLMNKVIKDDIEAYYANEGSPSVTLTFPDNANLKEIGITVEEESDYL